MDNDRRLSSLDALRGFDMFWITGGEDLVFCLAALTGWPFMEWAKVQMHHVPWEGFVFYDMIFPLFLFIAGVSLPFSILSRKKRGESLQSIYGHFFKRMILLVLFGFIYNGALNFDFANQRWASVLGRIGVAWFFAAIIALHASVRKQVYWFIGILLSYWAILMWIPVPGFGAGVLTPEGNLCAFIDQRLLPGFLCCYTYGDNEGILATFPAIATALLGVLAGHFLMAEPPWLTKIKKGGVLLAAGFMFLGCGKVWGWYFPVIKNLWTSSYVMYAGGWSLILLAVFYLIMDAWRIRRWAFPFTVIGMNAITIYMLSRGLFDFQTRTKTYLVDFESMSRFFFTGTANLFSEPVRPLIYVIGVIACRWGLLYFLYRKKIFLKV